jgi:hypothetical protein
LISIVARVGICARDPTGLGGAKPVGLTRCAGAADLRPWSLVSGQRSTVGVALFLETISPTRDTWSIAAGQMKCDTHLRLLPLRCSVLVRLGAEVGG